VTNGRKLRGEVLNNQQFSPHSAALNQREKRRLRVFENRVLRIIFGPQRDEVTGEWRKRHNEELRELYFSHYCAGDKIEKNGMGGYGGGEMRV
jgi:hypothetical protein